MLIHVATIAFKSWTVMDNGIYVSLSRELALFRDMDVTSGNIANAATTGYSASHLLFTSYLAKDVNQGDRNTLAFAHDISTYRDTDVGPMHTTSNPLDVAIQGKGYFSVETPLGTRYTRAGNFQLDATGVLVTAEGYPVLDNSNQRITFPEETTQVEIGGAGNVKVNGEDFATIGVVQFDNEQLLERVGGRLFKSEVAGTPVEDGHVVQGVLEDSNVKSVSELTHMISLSRSTADTAKLIEVVYDLQRKTNNAWAQQA